MFFRTAKECLSDIIFIVMISALVGIANYFITLVPFYQLGVLALFIGVAYLMGFDDGRNDPWN
jgi:hypothetical protein